jgi:endonuclease/exonuclease/phosphatase family metal-dependent hydrolase
MQSRALSSVGRVGGFAQRLARAVALAGFSLACSSSEGGSTPAGAGTNSGGNAGAASAAAGAASGSSSTAGGAGSAGAAAGDGGGAGLAGSAGSGNGGGNGGAAGMAGGGGQAQATELRITSSNIRYGTADDGVNEWEKRRALLFEVLSDQAFDSAGLQEALAFQLAELDTALPTYGRVGVGRDDGKTKGEYSAILYLKTRYEAVSSGTFWFSDTPETPGSKSWGNTLPRICTWARLKNIATGRHYYHYNVHYDHLSQPSREKSSQLLAARIAERPDQADPVIVTGDLNAEPENLAITYLLGTASIGGLQNPFKMKDAWLDFHAADPDSTTHHSFMGGTTGGIHIDYVMYGPGVTSKSAEIVRTHEGDVYPSDHYPVSGVLTLAP